MHETTPANPIDDAEQVLAARRRAALAVLQQQESLGQWVDANDLADRQAHARTRHDQASERPPHY